MILSIIVDGKMWDLHPEMQSDPLVVNAMKLVMHEGDATRFMWLDDEYLSYHGDRNSIVEALRTAAREHILEAHRALCHERGGTHPGSLDCERWEVKTTTSQMWKLQEIHKADVYIKTNGADGFIAYRLAAGGAMESVELGEGNTAEEALDNALGQAHADLLAKAADINSVRKRKQKPRGFRFDGAPKPQVTSVEIAGDETVEIGDQEEEA